MQGVIDDKVGCGLPWDVYSPVAVPCCCVEMEGTRLRELNAVDCPLRGGIAKGGDMCMVFPIDNVNDMN